MDSGIAATDAGGHRLRRSRWPSPASAGARGGDPRVRASEGEGGRRGAVRRGKRRDVGPGGGDSRGRGSRPQARRRDLSRALGPWANVTGVKAALKRHAAPDLRGPVPAFVNVTAGADRDRGGPAPPVGRAGGAVDGMERGDVDGRRLRRLADYGGFFVIRARPAVRLSSSPHPLTLKDLKETAGGGHLPGARSSCGGRPMRPGERRAASATPRPDSAHGRSATGGEAPERPGWRR